MGKWVVRGLDAHRTDYCRTGASSGATQRHSYERVPRFAGRFVVGASPYYRVARRGAKYWETPKKLVNIGTGQNSCACRLTCCRWIRSNILYLSAQK